MHEYAYTDALIRDSFEGFLNVFKQLAKLKGMKKRYNSDEEFLKEFGEKIGFNPSIFIEVLQPENRKSSLKDLFPAYLEELTKITENVDKTEI